jgi:hypothetical protein
MLTLAKTIELWKSGRGLSEDSVSLRTVRYGGNDECLRWW